MPSVQIGKALILCVDDNKTGLRLVNDILVRNGFAVLLASTVEKALNVPQWTH